MADEITELIYSVIEVLHRMIRCNNIDDIESVERVWEEHCKIFSSLLAGSFPAISSAMAPIREYQILIYTARHPNLNVKLSVNLNVHLNVKLGVDLNVHLSVNLDQ